MTIGDQQRRRRRLVLRASVLFGALAGVLLIAMVVVEAFGPRFINDPSTWLAEATLLIAALSVLLLAVDVVLPVPSTVVLVANGTIFGFAVGSVVSTLGLTASALLGYALGRRGASVTERFVGPATMHWLTTRVERHGLWAIGAARAVPLASELSALAAGASAMRRAPFVAAAIVGASAASIPLALLGAGSLDGGTTAVIAITAVAAGGALWLGGRVRMRQMSAHDRARR